MSMLASMTLLAQLCVRNNGKLHNTTRRVRRQERRVEHDVDEDGGLDPGGKYDGE